MYVTRPRSCYRNFRGALSEQPRADAPYTGHLVVSDEESEAMDSFCCGIWKNHKIKRLPFPSDKILQVVHSSLQEEATVTKIWFIPVLGKRIHAQEGKILGCVALNDVVWTPKPGLLIIEYQILEIRPYHSGGFCARSVEWDGCPPSFLRRGGWEVYTYPSSRLHLSETPGLRDNLTQTEFPEPNLPLHSRRSTPMVVGKWYCPFVYVKEEKMRVGDQMRKSLMYELRLKQWWEQIHLVENEDNRNNVVDVDTRVKRLLCLVEGVEGEKDGGEGSDGFAWFKVKGDCRGRGRVGLSSCLFEKMRWIQETRGWFDGEREVRVHGRKEIGSENVWRRFGCYMLVESFVLRRMDGSLLINFNFRNTERIVCKWE
ncbi:hypothetical protein ACS0TY_029222 [Phlomoides rotata]